MLPTLRQAALITALALANVSASNTDDQVGADIDYGSFQDPSQYVRPRVRYWMPDATVNLSRVSEDFRLIKEAGLGGMELLGYYLYGNWPPGVAEGGPVPVDWTEYGWGSPAWKELMDVALRATQENDLVMDFTLGPNQGAGVPAELNDDGVMWDLFPFNMSVPVGGTFDGTLPGWGRGTFISASTALVVARENKSYTASPGWVETFEYNGTQQVLASSSLQDVTNDVDEDGRLTVDFPSDTNGLNYLVFAYYEAHSEYRAQAPPGQLPPGSIEQSPVESYLQNGSRTADHFSAKGAQLIIDFWEQRLLQNGTKELVQAVGNYGWEDSYEFAAGALTWWTPGLLDAFRDGNGYSLNKYLPLIYSYDSSENRNAPLASPDHFFTDEADMGHSHVADYRQTITTLNQIYLETLTNWTRDSLNSQFSTQVAYNLPLDMLASVPSVNAPECESLGFDHIIDAYRQFAGPANLAGKRVISNELGALRNEVYAQTLPDLIWDVKRSIAGSVNQMVYHGYPFSGEYPNTTWPGYTTFAYRFSAMHGPRQPTWDYYRSFMDWTARTQYIAQRGVPKMDVVFWLKESEYYEAAKSAYEPDDLVKEGYTYEYLSPDNFALPEAYVEDGVLAPRRQAFKAMVIRQNQTLTVPGVEKLVQYAHDGLPIVFSGGVPQNLTGYNVSGTEYVRGALADLLDLDNVHIVPYENLAASLRRLHIEPSTRVDADRIWYTYWREDAEADASYLFVYNDAWDAEINSGASSGVVTIQATGRPYTYDAWTGETAPLYVYDQTETATMIPLTLAGNQSTIIALHHNETAAPALLSAPETVYSITSTPSTNSTNTSSASTLTLKASNHSAPLLLPNGSVFPLPPVPAPLNLTTWNLTIESWTSPADPFANQLEADKENTTHPLPDGLQPWNELTHADLRNISGRGFYRTTFVWPPHVPDTSNTTASTHTPQADGALLDLGALLNTATASLNGHALPPLDPTAARADLTPHLVQGENVLEVVVATTLENAIVPLWEDPEVVRSSGTVWDGPAPVSRGYGLVGEGWVRWWREVEV